VLVGGQFAKHETVKHSAKEYVRDDVHTNTVEGYFSIFKRGMKGTSTSIAAKRTCSAMLLSSISATATVLALAFEDTERAALIIKAGSRRAADVSNTSQNRGPIGKRLAIS
jgi:hypothetical protein